MVDPLPSRVAAPRTSRAQPHAVRLSITDRCDLACIYCRPQGRETFVRERLDARAWGTLLRGLRDAGIRRVRITGGEPLLHAEVVRCVETIASLGFEDVALTTNATRLAPLARTLRDAGLQRINVSLDSLHDSRFSQLTRGGRLAPVLRGIDAACSAGFDEVKLNTVVVRRINDDELEVIMRWAWSRGILPRFLELMPIGHGARLIDRVVTTREMRASIQHLIADCTPEAKANRGPARYVPAAHDANREVGFISGSSDTFCDGCDRLRVSSDGSLRPCLASTQGVAIVDDANTENAANITRAVATAWSNKPDGTVFRGCTEPSAAGVSMRAIGG